MTVKQSFWDFYILFYNSNSFVEPLLMVIKSSVLKLSFIKNTKHFKFSTSIIFTTLLVKVV